MSFSEAVGAGKPEIPNQRKLVEELKTQKPALLQLLHATHQEVQSQALSWPGERKGHPVGHYSRTSPC